MRIAVLGDFQFNLAEADLTESAMEDIAKVRPDLAITLGDYGGNGTLGTPKGIEQARRYLDRIGCTILPILGNHDLQLETGAGLYRHGTMSNTLCNLFGLDNCHRVEEFDRFRLFLISTDPQPPSSCYCGQECYLSDENFENIIVNLKKRPGVPAFFFTHAPPVGSGLVTVPHVHVRATNAFLDQNHDPYRWPGLLREFPEIVLWFAAHYHIGHMHPNSITERYGTVFFMTGVHSGVTRDQCRQTRIIDIAPDSICVRTLDHNTRALSDTADWEYKGSLSGLCEHKRSIINSKADGNHRQYKCPPDVLPLSQNLSAKIISDFHTGCGDIIEKGIVEAKNGRLLAATKNGFLWEIDMQYMEAMGTLHYKKPPLKAIAVTGSLVWRIWDNVVAVSDIGNPDRFVREAYDNKSACVCATLEEKAQRIYRNNDTEIRIKCKNKLYKAVFMDGSITVMEICAMNSHIMPVDKISLLVLYNRQLLLLANGRLFFSGPGPYKREEVRVDGYKAAAICRLKAELGKERICVAWNRLEGEKIPRFQIWEIEHEKKEQRGGE